MTRFDQTTKFVIVLFIYSITKSRLKIICDNNDYIHIIVDDFHHLKRQILLDLIFSFLTY